jgi:hypothetical protein
MVAGAGIALGPCKRLVIGRVVGRMAQRLYVLCWNPLAVGMIDDHLTDRSVHQWTITLDGWSWIPYYLVGLGPGIVKCQLNAILMSKIT